VRPDVLRGAGRSGCGAVGRVDAAGQKDCSHGKGQRAAGVGHVGAVQYGVMWFEEVRS